MSPFLFIARSKDAVRKQREHELQQLVEELCRIQNRRRYLSESCFASSCNIKELKANNFFYYVITVTALKLESLVGDLEDSVFHPMRGRSMLHVKLFEFH